jgi:hypothetical protein
VGVVVAADVDEAFSVHRFTPPRRKNVKFRITFPDSHTHTYRARINLHSHRHARGAIRTVNTVLVRAATVPKRQFEWCTRSSSGLPMFSLSFHVRNSTSSRKITHFETKMNIGSGSDLSTL